MTPTKIVLLIDNVHMGLGHDGLTAVARKFKKNPEALQDGELLMFLNRRRDKLKIMGSAGRVIGYLKMPKGNKIMLEAIQYIPQAFGASGINYDYALRSALQSRLVRRVEESRRGPLQAWRAALHAGVAPSAN